MRFLLLDTGWRMKCEISGCLKRSRNKSGGPCEMHYYRKRRTGSYDAPKYKHRTVTSHGYVVVTDWGHPLASKKTGWVYEHRKVLFDSVAGRCPNCDLCGRDLQWSSCHADHINENKQDNRIENIRALCVRCNTHRCGKSVEASRSRSVFLTVDGVTRTAAEWASLPHVKVSKSAILRRKKSGMSDCDAIFSEKVTHNGKVNGKFPRDLRSSAFEGWL